ncbi:MAG: thiamine phosphate synthase [Candidatus Omnitrophica bacterium]|nr:thiamine phosphate synthase [Candidatus Omnitrophota bacterium]
MSWKERLLRNSRLYVLVDNDLCSGQLIKIARQAISAGADIIQLRFKNGFTIDKLRLAQIIRKLSLGKSLFIVNDHIDIALAVGADGVHLGQDDLPIEIARKILGRPMLIGISCHSLKQAKEAEHRGADYIGVGPVFLTSAKPKLHPIGPKVLAQIKKNIRIPFFAIGGIKQNNLKQILDCGVKKVVIGSAVCKSKTVNKTIQEFKKLLK